MVEVEANQLAEVVEDQMVEVEGDLRAEEVLVRNPLGWEASQIQRGRSSLNCETQSVGYSKGPPVEPLTGS